MSTSLVRTSLDLLGYDDDVKRGKKKRKIQKSEGVLSLIPSNHRIQKQGKKDKNKLENTSSKVSIDDIRVQLNKKTDQTDKNIEKLLLLSSNKIDYLTSEKLLHRATKKRYIAEVEKPKLPEQTAFTEEDFKKFEAEYLAE